MGVWTTYCCVCGLTTSDLASWYDIDAQHEKNISYETEKAASILKKNKWNEKWGIILQSGKFLSSSYSKEYYEDGTVEFDNFTVNLYNAGMINNFDSSDGNPTKPGYLIHGTCYTLLKEKIPTSTNLFMLLYSVSELNKIIRPDGYLKGINYGPIKKYARQDFEVFNCVDDGNLYLLLNPKYNKENMDRIQNIIKQIKTKGIPKLAQAEKKLALSKKFKVDANKLHKIKSIKSKSPKLHRPSPPESATSFPVGKRKKGNDNNMYVVVKNKNNIKRWVKV